MLEIRSYLNSLYSQERISASKYVSASNLILYDPLWPWETLPLYLDVLDMLHGEQESQEKWWLLHSSNRRVQSKRKHMSKNYHGQTHIKVVELDRQVPKYFSDVSVGLVRLISSVAKERGINQPESWDDFSAAISEVYRLKGSDLHDMLRGAVVKEPGIAEILIRAENGETLLPDDLVSGMCGESVSQLVARAQSEDVDYSYDKNAWMLKYKNINTLVKAFIVRNRLRRIFRLWVSKCAVLDTTGAAHHGRVGMALSFGKVKVGIPDELWERLRSSVDLREGNAKSEGTKQ